jgi:plastocyanin
MIWRWLTCFSVGLGVALGALVTGEVELTNSRNLAVRKHKDYTGVVLWLEPVDRPVPALPPKHVEMQQRDKLFQPHVVAISLGGTVDLPNLDLIFHNAFSNFSGQPFDIGLYAPRTSKSVTFKHAGIVRVFCNMHSS